MRNQEALCGDGVAGKGAAKMPVLTMTTPRGTTADPAKPVPRPERRGRLIPLLAPCGDVEQFGRAVAMDHVLPD